MRQFDELRVEIEHLKRDVQRIEAALQRVAGLITRHAMHVSPLPTGDLPLRERLEVLEFRVDRYLEATPRESSDSKVERVSPPPPHAR